MVTTMTRTSATTKTLTMNYTHKGHIPWGKWCWRGCLAAGPAGVVGFILWYSHVVFINLERVN